MVDKLKADTLLKSEGKTSVNWVYLPILIKVTPSTAEYWDSSSSKMVTAFKMLKSIVTGDKPDMGEHDKLTF